MAFLAGLTDHRGVLAVVAFLALVATLGVTGCDDKAGADNAKVKIAGQTFYLETAMDDGKRFTGLSNRAFIEENGGMIFVFTEPRDPRIYGGFVMRDCPVDIDIMYLDKSGRVLTAHEMKAEPARDASKGEGTPADATNEVYNSRLKQYTSRFPFTFVIELKGGRMKQLGVKEGDLVEFDRDGLLKRAR